MLISTKHNCIHFVTSLRVMTVYSFNRAFNITRGLTSGKLLTFTTHGVHIITYGLHNRCFFFSVTS